jgi:hypothetical protein
VKRLAIFLAAVLLFFSLGVTTAAAADVDYFIWDSFGGDWADAEKTPAAWAEVSLLCWAATSSNILEWTGWGFVPGPFVGTDDMFAYYAAHWTNLGSIPHYAWNWWFDGTLPPDWDGWSEVDVSGGGFWPGYTFTNYSSYVTTDIMQNIAGWLMGGNGVGIWISSPTMEHEITVWGFRYDDAFTPADPANYYKGVWVTDSDDDDNTNSPPDSLRYYDVAWNAGTGLWEATGSWYWWIKQVDALAVFPDTTRPVAEAGTYSVPEGTAVLFDGSASTDADGDVLTYRWDFEFDSTFRLYDTWFDTDPTAPHLWMDDYAGIAVLQVFDNHLRDVDTASVTIYNVAPSVDAGPDQSVLEAEEVTFTGNSVDPGSDDATFTWDFGDGTAVVTKTFYNDGSGPDPSPSTEGSAMSVTDTVTHTYGDDGEFTVTLTVADDDGGVSTDTLVVTVGTVDPIVTPITFAQPNSEFILPQVHELSFSADSSDPGSDDATYSWDFGDGGTTSNTYFNDGAGPDPYPSPDVHPVSSSDSVNYTYSNPGDYTTTLVVSDDDTGATSVTYGVHVADVGEALDISNAYIQSLPDSAFKDKPDSRKTAFDKMFGALRLMLDQSNYLGMIRMLNSNIRTATDGTLGGELRDDWIVDPAVQTELCQKIDDISAYLEYLATLP